MGYSAGFVDRYRKNRWERMRMLSKTKMGFSASCAGSAAMFAIRFAKGTLS
jgi:hypothetical protein